MNITLEIKQPGKIDKKLKKLADATEKNIDLSIPEALVSIQGQAVKLVQNKSPGTTYYRYSGGLKRKVTAAKEGQPPNTDLGDLVRSIKWEYDKRRNEGVVGSNLKKAAWLELGTKRMGPRPFLRPALDKVKKLIPKNLIKSLRSKLYKKAGKL